MMMKLGSLFSGIGGIELGFERTGQFKTIWHCEIEPYPSAVLAERFPGVANYGDITKVDWTRVERPDVLVGGFPCQDISVAGKGKGIKEGTRSGLWSEYARAIRELQPRYVVVENVAMLARRGLTRVLGDLAALGYDAEWKIISASSVGAPHRRERLFIIAYTRNPHGRECGEKRAVPQGDDTINIRSGEDLVPNSDNPRQGLWRDEQLQEGAGDEGIIAHAARERCVEHEGLPQAVQQSRADKLLPNKSQEPELSESLYGTHAPHPDHNGASGQARAEEGRRGLQAEPHDNADAPDLPCERRAIRASALESGGELLNTEERNPVGCESSRSDEFAVFRGITSVKELFNRPDIPEPLLRKFDDGPPAWVGVCRNETIKKGINPINGYGTEKEGTGEVVRVVRGTNGAEELQRAAGGVRLVQTEEILQQGVCGDGTSKGDTNPFGVSKTDEATTNSPLRDVQCRVEPPSASQEPTMVGQHSNEPDDVVRVVPFEASLAEWKETIEKACCLHCLWKTCSEVGFMRETLPAFKEVWESQNEEDKRWLILQARNGGIRLNRKAMTKALGNAVVPACAEVVARRVIEMEASK